MNELKEKHETERVSKSQRKRDSDALTVLAGELAKLSGEQCELLNMPIGLTEALVLVRTIKKHGAHKRQIKFIGGLLRKMDVEPIIRGLDRLQSKSADARRFHHRVENWRDRLISTGDTELAKLVEVIPEIDRQRIRQLIRDANRQILAGQPPTASRTLYRYLREQLSSCIEVV